MWNPQSSTIYVIQERCINLPISKVSFTFSNQIHNVDLKNCPKNISTNKKKAFSSIVITNGRKLCFTMFYVTVLFDSIITNILNEKYFLSLSKQLTNNSSQKIILTQNANKNEKLQCGFCVLYTISISWEKELRGTGIWKERLLQNFNFFLFLISRMFLLYFFFFLKRSA